MNIQENLYPVDSDLGRDGERLRPFLQEAPLALEALNRYQF